MRKILVTGTAGFVGFHLAKALLEAGDEVTGLDNINPYYDPELKFARLNETGISKEAAVWDRLAASTRYPKYRFIRMDLANKERLLELFKSERFDHVIHLAAQTGVRFSIENPDVYIQSNIAGFFNILEACRRFPVKHLVFASSSSVYGNNKRTPFRESDPVDQPISLYAATKKSDELMAYTYSHLYRMPVTGLRFFTVYGPWGRPDMAYFKFTKAVLEGKPIDVYNSGNMERDFTYVDDIVTGVIKVCALPPAAPADGQAAPYRLFNIGNHQPVKLSKFIREIEDAAGKRAVINNMPMQPGDVTRTCASIDKLKKMTGFKPRTPLREGIKAFVTWYKAFCGTGRRPVTLRRRMSLVSNDPVKISVAMATYNGERFLGEQLASIARQRRLPDEMVVTDDGSTDATISILERFAASSPFPVRIYKNPQRLGYGENFIKAASLCNGELIAFSDQDDVWLKDKLSTCLPYFEDREVVLSVHTGAVVDDKLRLLGWNIPDIRKTEVIFDRHIFRNAFQGFAMIFRKNLPGIFANPRPMESYYCTRQMSHDKWISILAKMFGKTAFIKEALVLYRRHATVTTAPKNLGFTDLVTMSKEASSESYSEIEQWISSIGSVLGRIEVRTDNEMLMRQAGVEHCRRKQEAFSYRAGMYACDRNFIHRVNVFFKMLNTGYYGPLQKGGLGLKSLLKDLSRLLTG